MDLFIVQVWNEGLPGFALLAITLVLLTLLAIAAVPLRVLTRFGSIVAYGFGVFFLLVGGVPYLLLMVVFVTLGGLATRYRLAEKRWRKVSEGIEGERRTGNVLAHTIPGALLLLLAFIPGVSASSSLIAFLYTSALAFGAADTYASEIGVLSPRPVSIVGGGFVPPGTDGGITLLGEAAAFAGGYFLSLCGALAFEVFDHIPGNSFLLFVLLATAAGWIGCQLDSLLGATLERRGYLGKNQVNLIAMVLTMVMALGMWFAL